LVVQVLTENTGRKAELDKVAQELKYALNVDTARAAVAMCLECIISKCTTSLQPIVWPAAVKDIALSGVPIDESRCFGPQILLPRVLRYEAGSEAKGLKHSSLTITFVDVTSAPWYIPKRTKPSPSHHQASLAHPKPTPYTFCLMHLLLSPSLPHLPSMLH
jgi:hypothetical protein